MMLFKRFAADTPEIDISNFINDHNIIKDHFASDGVYMCFYREFSDIGMDTQDQLELLASTIYLAEKEKFTTESGLIETQAELADLEETIARTPAHEKEWDKLMAEKQPLENQIKMQLGTISTRVKQIADLRDRHAELLKTLP